MLLLSTWASIPGHAQSTQNDKFAKSLQYLKKELGHEAFFNADKD